MKSISRREFFATLGMASTAVAVLASIGQAEAADAMLLNVSYDPTRELYKAINPIFAGDWKARSGENPKIQVSHGGPAPRRAP